MGQSPEADDATPLCMEGILFMSVSDHEFHCNMSSSESETENLYNSDNSFTVSDHQIDW